MNISSNKSSNSFSDNLIKLSFVFWYTESSVSKLTTNIPEKFLNIFKNINEGFHGSMVYYENKIKEENKI